MCNAVASIPVLQNISCPDHADIQLAEDRLNYIDKQSFTPQYIVDNVRNFSTRIDSECIN